MTSTKRRAWSAKRAHFPDSRVVTMLSALSPALCTKADATAYTSLASSTTNPAGVRLCHRSRSREWPLPDRTGKRSARGRLCRSDLVVTFCTLVGFYLHFDPPERCCARRAGSKDHLRDRSGSILLLRIRHRPPPPTAMVSCCSPGVAAR